MNCIECGKILTNKCFKSTYLIHCKKCGSIYNLADINGPKTSICEKETIADILNIEMITSNFEVSQRIICIDPKNQMFLEYGIVTAIEPLFIKIKFKNTALWMPKRIIQKIPEEWL
jgi:hypothetical protein